MDIYVGNLHSNVSEAQLRDLFEEYGTVNSVTIIMDVETGQSKKVAFVEMEEDASGLNAIQKLNKLNFMNMYLEICAADKRLAKNSFWKDSAKQKDNDSSWHNKDGEPPGTNI